MADNCLPTDVNGGKIVRKRHPKVPSGEWVAPDGSVRQFWNGKTQRQEIWLGRDRDSEAWAVSVLIEDEMFMFDHDDKASAEAMYLRLMSERIASGAA